MKLSQGNVSIAFTWRGERRRKLVELFSVISCGLLDRQRTQIFAQLYCSLQREDTRIWQVLLGGYSGRGGGPYTMAGTFSGHLTACGDVRITEKLIPDVGLALEGLSTRRPEYCITCADHTYPRGTLRPSVCAGSPLNDLSLREKSLAAALSFSAGDLVCLTVLSCKKVDTVLSRDTHVQVPIYVRHGAVLV